MTDATELWTAVVAAYDADGLITLTNIRDRSATSVDTTVGQTAAQSVIDLWPAYTQVAYDSTSALHVEVAIRGVIATLWARGGASSTIAKVEWDEVFGPDGMMSKVKRVGPRGHPQPKSTSGLSTSGDTTESGRNTFGWSDKKSLPSGVLPRVTPDD